MPFLNQVSCEDQTGHSDEVGSGHQEYPFAIPAVTELCKSGLKLNPGVTFFVGENGSGKSTILEGIADRWGFDREGGSRTRNLVTRSYWSHLGPSIFLSRAIAGVNPMDGFFLRAESFFNFASMLDDFEEEEFTGNDYFNYGGKSLHEQSHGEAFLSLFMNRFGEHGLYILDEPEAALSPQRQLAFLVRMHDLVEAHCQFIIATHSPILLGFPGATIYRLDETGIEETAWENSDPYQVTKRFLNNRDQMLSYLFAEDEGED